MLDRLPTRINLMRRGVVLDTNFCLLCLLNICSLNVTLHNVCGASALDGLAFSSFNIRPWIVTFSTFIYHFLTAKQNQVWKGLNVVIFKQRIPDVKEIFQTIQLKSWLWMKYRIGALCYSFTN